MSDGRFTVLPDARLSALKGIVSTRMDEVALAVTEQNFDDFFTPTMRGAFLEGLSQADADEGTVWLLDATEKFLHPRFNNGPHAASFVNIHKQSLHQGMVSMVAVTEQPICENEVHRNERYDPELDKRLGLRTCAMLAVPLYFSGQLRGVLSAVKLLPAGSDAPAPSGFTPENLRSLQLTADVLERLIEHELLTLSLGLGITTW